MFHKGFQMAKKTISKGTKPPGGRRRSKPVTAIPQRTQAVEEAAVIDDLRSKEEDNDRFCVVAVGASAGGLEAFTQLLQALPTDTGMAYVFVQHLDPKHVSLLNEILQRQTALPVREVEQGTRVEPDHIYVIPRNKTMELVDGVLQLSPRPQGVQNMPIDTFFRSVAKDKRDQAIGVILSGNASDGALGMTAIKAEGGITFAQDVDSAKFDSMPRSAIAAGCVDFVLAPDEIAKELARLGQHPYVLPLTKDAAVSKLIPDASENLVRIAGVIRAQTGVDFAGYKQSTIQRRILRRMALKRVETLDAYLARLRSDPAEVRALFEDILINVTEFFREPETFDALKEMVFKDLLNRPEHGTIRIWVPGCATGEEVYSIAIALSESIEELSRGTAFQIFGTDISETSLERARSATYTESMTQNVSRERLRKFFVKGEAGYQVNKRVREMCVFARQDVAKDPPFSKLDLLSCRNLLIYLGPQLQRRVLPIFHYALKPSGYLFLGSSETIGSFQELFSPVDKKQKIYRRLPFAPHLPADFAMPREKAPEAEGAKLDSWSEGEVIREADRIALAKYGPPGVVVDDALNILQFRGHTGPYLEPAAGAASLNLSKMARQGLLVELGSLVSRARKEGGAARREGLRLRTDGELREVSIEVIPFKRTQGRARLFLILFETVARRSRLSATGSPEKGVRKVDPSALKAENAQLRQDLDATKEYLQSINEEHEAATEELRSANEEIQSSNEELRSTNEELETAKEELQSTNEELNTLNEETADAQHAADPDQQRLDQSAECREYTDRDAGKRSADPAFYTGVREDTELDSIGHWPADQRYQIQHRHSEPERASHRCY